MSFRTTSIALVSHSLRSSGTRGVGSIRLPGGRFDLKMKGQETPKSEKCRTNSRENAAEQRVRAACDRALVHVAAAEAGEVERDVFVAQVLQPPHDALAVLHHGV